MNLHTIILAAGEGKRMKSALPKVLHPIGGVPMLARVIKTAQQLNSNTIHLVHGNNKELLATKLPTLDKINWVHQNQQLGTAHAVSMALPFIPKETMVLILYGDIPLIPLNLLRFMLKAGIEHEITLITTMLANPRGFGRIVRNFEGKITAIVEEKDASNLELGIKEINTGIMLIRAELLHHYLPLLKNNNAQKEYYLTDIISSAVKDGYLINGIKTPFPEEVLGVNDRYQLANLERYYQRHVAQQLMLDGVTIMDPMRFDLRGSLVVGQDVSFDINVLLEGKIKIGNNSTIGANVILRDVILGNNVQILPNTIIEESEIGDNCIVGPFARIRPKTKLKARVKIGNFVEIKKTTIAENTKANHLTYLGDATIGKNVNIGAGTIICNYDGVNKYPTVIEDDVFIGSDCQLVPPIKIGKGATIGAGSTITEDAPPQKLTLARARQCTIDHWKRTSTKTNPKK